MSTRCYYCDAYMEWPRQCHACLADFCEQCISVSAHDCSVAPPDYYEDDSEQ